MLSQKASESLVSSPLSIEPSFTEFTEGITQWSTFTTLNLFMYQNAQLFLFDVEFHIQRQDRIKAECYMEINLKKIWFEFEAKNPSHEVRQL